MAFNGMPDAEKAMIWRGLSCYLQLGRIPDEKEKRLVVETPDITYKIEEIKTVRGGYVFAGNVFDNNGNPVIVSLLPHPINRNGYQLDVHKFTSAYAKDNAQQEQNKIYF